MKVRDLRLAHEEEEALEQLKRVVDFQREYHTTLDFNSSSFQGKETLALWPYQKSKVHALLEQKRPMAAELRWRAYRDVFTGVSETAALVRRALAPS